MDSIGQFQYAKFAPVLPPLADGRDTRRHRVAIAGGGPVGMAIALGLARYGIASVIIEADDSVCVGSRAICISRRSLEILSRLGAGKAFLEKGLPWVGGRSYVGTTEVFQFKMPHDADQKLPPMVNLQQYYIEQFLLDEVNNHPDLIEIRWASRVTALQARPDGVSLTVANDLGEYELDADWLVAADGGQSFVRHALGLRLKGIPFEGKYVIADIELDTDLPVERLAWFDPPSNPGLTMLMHRQPDNIWRVDYQVADDVDPDAAIREENVVPVIQKHLESIGQRGAWKPVWISMYRAGAMSLENYWHGRVLFAGNAAHVLPIFGVRGLNSGFDGAYNLSWKLAFVVTGWSPASILASYSQERIQAFDENAAYAVKSTEFMAPPSRGFALMRQAALSLAEKFPAIASLMNPRQTSPVTYADSPLNGGEAGAFAAGPRVGGVLAECPVRESGADAAATHLTDLLDDCFTALVFAANGRVEAGLAETLARLRQGKIPFRSVVVTRSGADAAAADGQRLVADVTGRLYPLYGAVDGTVYLVRPDGHVCARWRQDAAARLPGALARATGNEGVGA